MTKTKSSMGSDHFGILAAIWILSCNDRIPYMTYEGIRYRLGLPEGYNLPELISKYGELFRREVPWQRLDRWKELMLGGDALPSWIAEKKETAEQQAAISSLTPQDLFRNQFRVELESPSAPVEILEWGLEHIERLRKASVEAREERIKRWTSIRMPLLTMCVSAAIALTTVLVSGWMQSRSMALQAASFHTQERLKYYEVELKPKLESYSAVMGSLVEASTIAQRMFV